MTFAHMLVGTVAIFGIYWTIKYLLLPKPPPPPPVKKQKTTTTVKAATETTETEMTTETTAVTSENMTQTKPGDVIGAQPQNMTVANTTSTSTSTSTATTRTTRRTTTRPPWCGRATDHRQGRRCYRMFPPRTWLGARQHCEDGGGHLTNAYTRLEEEQLSLVMAKQPRNSFELVAVGVRTSHYKNHFFDYDSVGKRIDRALHHGTQKTTPGQREFNCVGPKRYLSWVPTHYQCHFICEYMHPRPRAP